MSDRTPIAPEAAADAASSARPGTRRCRMCGARNPGNAAWCGQCLARFEPEGEQGSPPPSEPRTRRETSSPDPAPAAGPRPGEVHGDPDAARVRDAFAASSEGLSWTCRLCDTINPLAADRCTVCGAGLAETLRPPPPRGPIRDPGTAALVSMAWPGAGHAYLGMWGQAVARAVTSAWVLAVTGIALLQQGPTAPMAVAFGLAAFALWVVAAHDAYRESLRQSSAALLRGRALLWVVVGLLVLAFAMLAAGALGARTP